MIAVSTKDVGEMFITTRIRWFVVLTHLSKNREKEQNFPLTDIQFVALCGGSNHL